MAGNNVVPQMVELPLATASAEDYCTSVLAVRNAETWWWQTGLAPYRGYSRPFQDRDGRWWWRGKPQFSWPMDYFTPLSRSPRMPVGRSLIGWQYPADAEKANSLARFNVIHDLGGFDLTRVAAKQRSPIRKGLRELEIGLLDPAEPSTTEEVRIVWNSHVQRTSWSKQCGPATFAGWWRPLADMAGTSVLGARDKQTGLLRAWLIARTVGDTLYVDTIASHTARLGPHPNHTLIFVLLHSAAQLDGVTHANYFLRSNLQSLEKFKQSMGFDSSGLASRLHVNALVGAGLRLLRPALWQRLRGDWTDRSSTS